MKMRENDALIVAQSDGKGQNSKKAISDDYSIDLQRQQLANARDKIHQLNSDILGYKNIQNE